MNSTSDNLITIAENQKTLYESGVKEGIYYGGYNLYEAKRWDDVLARGNRRLFHYAFSRWNCEYIRPPYKIIAASNENSTTRGTKYMFCYNPSLKIVEKDYFDLSGVQSSQTSSNTGNCETFRECTSLEEIQDIKMPAGYYYYTFAGCSNLKTIEALYSVKETKYTSAFTKCKSLENISINGTIGRDFNISGSPKLTIESIESIVNALYCYKLYDEEGNAILDENGNEMFECDPDDRPIINIGNDNEKKVKNEAPYLLEEIERKGWILK